MQSARNSINTGGQSSFWPLFLELKKQHLYALQLASLCASLEESCCCSSCNQQILVLAWTLSWLWFGLSDQLLLLLLGALSLEKGAPPLFGYLAQGCFQNDSLSRLRCLGVASAYGWVTILLYCLWLNKHIHYFITVSLCALQLVVDIYMIKVQDATVMLNKINTLC